MKRHGAVFFGVAASVFLSASTTTACVLPVFRYALERWSPASYRISIYHQDPLAFADSATVSRMTHDSLTNISIRMVDMDSLSSADSAVLDSIRPPKLPCVLVHRPAQRRASNSPLWTCALDSAPVAAMIDSPVRRWIAGRILSGESVVWVVLRSGDKTRDKVFETRLKRHLDSLTRALRLPVFSEYDVPMWYDPGRGPVLRIAFSVVAVDPDDPGESFLSALLRRSAPEVADSAGPLAFPVFGQGRCFGGFTEDQLTDRQIDNLCRFMTGSCSCEIKEQNPGFDLLMRADWYRRPSLSHPNRPQAAFAGLTGGRPGSGDSSASRPQPGTTDSSTMTPVRTSFDIRDSESASITRVVDARPVPETPLAKGGPSVSPLIRNLLLTIGGIFLAVLMAMWSTRGPKPPASGSTRP